MLTFRSAALALVPLLLTAASVAEAALTTVFSHTGCVDPTTVGPDPTLEGWTLQGLVPPGSVGAACGDSGVDAWQVSDADALLSGPHYVHDTSAVVGAAAGWTLRARVRVRDLSDPADGSAELEVSIGGRRFRLLLGSDALGNTLVRREGDTADTIAQTRSYQQTGYQVFEIGWDPTRGVAGQADVFIDGLPRPELANWDGVATTDARVLFGGDDATGTGTARFSDLTFQVGVQECRDGIDNDADGRTDLATDPGCDTTTDSSEKSVLRVCDDGLDNDADGKIDKVDPDCAGVNGRSEIAGFQIVTTGEAAWAAAAGGQELSLDTTGANVGLATEVGFPPPPGTPLCGPTASTPVPSCVLSYAAANTHLCRDWTLRSLEAGAGMTFDDSAKRGGNAAWQNALSIGGIGTFHNDDFEFDFGAGQPVYAFGFNFVDNQRENDEGLTIYGPGDQLLGILPGPAAPLSDGNRIAFVGIVSPVPITRVVFDEDTTSDDLAIRDLRFGDPDPDADGLGDCTESSLGTDPDLADTDADGLTDGAEVNVHGTDPLDPDTDGDHFSDGVEVAAGTDPRDPASHPAIVPVLDTTGRGIAAALLLLVGLVAGRRRSARRMA